MYYRSLHFWNPTIIIIIIIVIVIIIIIIIMIKMMIIIIILYYLYCAKKHTHDLLISHKTITIVSQKL